MNMLTHISFILLLLVGGGLAQGQAAVTYDPVTGEAIVPATPLAAERASTTHVDRPAAPPIDYDPLTGLPIEAEVTVPPPTARSSKINPLVLSRMGRLSATKDHRQGNWTYINTMTATGGALVAGLWTGIVTQAPFLMIMAGVAGGYASSAIVANGKMNNNMPDRIAESTKYEKQIYQAAYQRKFNELRKRQTFAGILIAGITGLMFVFI